MTNTTLTTETTQTSGPDFISLQVRDMEKSSRFYQDQLGLALAPGGPPGAVVFNTTPIPFALRPPMVDLDSVTHLGWGVGLWIKVADADVTCARLRQAGTTVLGDPKDGPFGRFFSFFDPDGYTITVHSGS